MSDKPDNIVMRLWTEQRWLLDNIIRAVGVDWDQPRTVSYNTPNDCCAHSSVRSSYYTG